MGLIADLIMENVRANRAEEYGQRYKGLLDQYMAPQAGPPAPTPYDMDPALAGPPDPRSFPAAGAPGGGLLREPPPAFFLQAGAIPGYREMALQGQVGAQAMQRQQQAQEFSLNNMTMAERASQELDRWKTEKAQERQQFEWNNPSAYQQGNLALQALGVSQANDRGLQQLALQGGDAARQAAQFNANYLPDPDRPGYFKPRPQAPAPLGFADQVKVQQAYQNAQGALTFLEDVERVGTPYFSSAGKGAAWKQEADVKLRPLAMAIFQPMGGEPSPAVQKKIDEFIGDPTDWQSSERRAAKMALIRSEVAKQWAPYRGLMPDPVAIPGASATAQSYAPSIALPANVKPFQPTGAWPKPEKK